jgi:hypothetical protein
MPKIKFKVGDIISIPLTTNVNGYGMITKIHKSAIFVE